MVHIPGEAFIFHFSIFFLGEGANVRVWHLGCVLGYTASIRPSSSRNMYIGSLRPESFPLFSLQFIHSVIYTTYASLS